MHLISLHYLLFTIILYSINAEDLKIAEHSKSRVISCKNKKGIWFMFNQSENTFQNITNDNTNYKTNQTHLTILNPKDGTKFQLKNNDIEQCTFVLKVFVHPENYIATIIMNNQTPIYGTFNNSIPFSSYKQDLLIKDPFNFTINYTYRLEGIPLDNLTINNHTIESKPCNSTISWFRCLEANHSVNLTNLDLAKELKWYFSYDMDSKLVEMLNGLYISIKKFEINIIVKFPPKLSANEEIYFKEKEKLILNCTPLFSNPAVEKYNWNSSTKGFKIMNIDKSTYEFEMIDKLDTIEIICNASNGISSSIKKFTLIRFKNKPVESSKTLPSWAIGLIIVAVLLSLVVLIASLIYCYVKKICCWKKKNNTPSRTASQITQWPTPPPSLQQQEIPLESWQTPPSSRKSKKLDQSPSLRTLSEVDFCISSGGSNVGSQSNLSQTSSKKLDEPPSPQTSKVKFFVSSSENVGSQSNLSHTSSKKLNQSPSPIFYTSSRSNVKSKSTLSQTSSDISLPPPPND